MNVGIVKWRKLLYAMNLRLLRNISRSTETPHDKPVPNYRWNGLLTMDFLFNSLKAYRTYSMR